MTARPQDPFGPGVHSYNRMAVVLGNVTAMPRNSWFRQLGNAWSTTSGSFAPCSGRT
jgi:hypothetical protein